MQSSQISKLVEGTKNFKFSPTNNSVTVAEVLSMIAKIDMRYRNYAMFNQVSRILFMPYIIVFRANETIILQPFIEIFEALKEYLFSNTTSFDSSVCRFIIHDRLIIIDVNPRADIRTNLGLYSITKKTFSFNEDNIAKLDYFQEVEIKIDNTLEQGFKIYKQV
jgi:hypothetical protein